jgi:hypothetical protein
MVFSVSPGAKNSLPIAFVKSQRSRAAPVVAEQGTETLGMLPSPAVNVKLVVPPSVSVPAAFVIENVTRSGSVPYQLACTLVVNSHGLYESLK